ncbi:hypothetical protein XELAEV_18042199mg, partial [Xenopus laevis]
ATAHLAGFLPGPSPLDVGPGSWKQGADSELPQPRLPCGLLPRDRPRTRVGDRSATGAAYEVPERCNGPYHPLYVHRGKGLLCIRG